MKRQNYRLPIRLRGCPARLKELLVLTLLVGLCATAQAADTNAPSKGQLQAASSSKGKGKSKPVISERPQVLSLTTTSTDPGKPGRPVVDTSVPTQLITQFQASRDQYLEAQKEQSLQAKTVTEEQRELVREKARDAQAKWQEEHRMYVEEQKERAKQMKQDLQADLGRVVDGAGSSAGPGRSR